MASTHGIHPVSDESTNEGVEVKKALSQLPPDHTDWSEEWRSLFTDISRAAMDIEDSTVSGCIQR